MSWRDILLLVDGIDLVPRLHAVSIGGSAANITRLLNARLFQNLELLNHVKPAHVVA